jgi:hypothetical protein
LFPKTNPTTAITLQGDIGLYLALISGFVYDRFGPRTVTVVGTVLTGGGYLLLWHQLTQQKGNGLGESF